MLSRKERIMDGKKIMIKKFAQVSPCCICGGIPSLEIIYDVEFASRVERYGEACANRVFSRNDVL